MPSTSLLAAAALLLAVPLLGQGGVVYSGRDQQLAVRAPRMPGDIAIEGRRGSFYFPIVTCLLLSVVMTLVLWLVGYLRR